LIKDWARFNPLKIRSANAKVHIDTWNGSVGAKAELHQVWMRVSGIPYNKRSIITAAYAGSLVGATVEVDKGTMSRTDYVRVKIVVKDETKIHAVVEVAIIPFLYDFLYEREVTMDDNNPVIPVLVNVDKGFLQFGLKTGDDDFSRFGLKIGGRFLS
jgi:hypothetical protein